MSSIAYPQHGAVVFWNCVDSVRRDVEAAFGKVGLESCVPEPVTDNMALKSAMVELHGGKDRIVQSHRKKEKNGFELVRVQREEHQNAYVIDFCAKIVDGQVRTWNGEVDRWSLQDAYRKHKEILKASQVGQALVDAVNALNGQRLTDRGGVYWVPEEGVDTWASLAAYLVGAGVDKINAVHMMHTILTPSTVQAIKEQLTQEIQREAERITIDITDSDLSENAVYARKTRADNLRMKVNHYAEILGDALEECHGVLRLAEAAMSAALAIEQHGETGEMAGVFE